MRLRPTPRAVGQPFRPTRAPRLPFESPSQSDSPFRVVVSPPVAARAPPSAPPTRACVSSSSAGSTATPTWAIFGVSHSRRRSPPAGAEVVEPTPPRARVSRRRLRVRPGGATNASVSCGRWPLSASTARRDARRRGRPRLPASCRCTSSPTSRGAWRSATVTASPPPTRACGQPPPPQPRSRRTRAARGGHGGTAASKTAHHAPHSCTKWISYVR